MEDHARTSSLLESILATEDACVEYLCQLRWPDGFRCVRCGGSDAWRTGRGMFRCRRCDAQTSVIVGTAFQGTHKPLRLWLRAMWHVVQSPHGASAKEIERLLELGSYRTAWSWMHKLRRVMVRPGRDRLGGTVQVDEAFIGSKRALRRRPGPRATLLMVAVGQRRTRSGPIRILRLRDGSHQSLLSAVQEMVDPSAIVRTDRSPIYMPGIELMGYRHQPFRLYPGAVGIDPLPLVADVTGRLGEWLQGRLHGAVSPAHLDYYLAEFTFRYNHQASRFPDKAFRCLLRQALETKPTPD